MFHTKEKIFSLNKTLIRSLGDCSYSNVLLFNILLFFKLPTSNFHFSFVTNISFLRCSTLLICSNNICNCLLEYFYDGCFILHCQIIPNVIHLGKYWLSFLIQVVILLVLVMTGDFFILSSTFMIEDSGYYLNLLYKEVVLLFRFNTQVLVYFFRLSF